MAKPIKEERLGSSFDSDNCNFAEECLEEQLEQAGYSLRQTLVESQPAQVLNQDLGGGTQSFQSYVLGEQSLPGTQPQKAT